MKRPCHRRLRGGGEGVNDSREGWSTEDIKVGTYVCFAAHEDSEYSKVGFEIGKVVELPLELLDEAEVIVEYMEFDK